MFPWACSLRYAAAGFESCADEGFEAVSSGSWAARLQGLGASSHFRRKTSVLAQGFQAIGWSGLGSFSAQFI